MTVGKQNQPEDQHLDNWKKLLVNIWILQFDPTIISYDLNNSYIAMNSQRNSNHRQEHPKYVNCVPDAAVYRKADQSVEYLHLLSM